MDDFRLYPSNALDVLAGLLAAELRKPAEGAALLAPDTILIPQVAMKRWLQATLAAEYGIAANLEFITPGEFVARALEANLGKASSDLDMAAMQWRLYGALTDAGMRQQPALQALAAYLGDARQAGADPLKPWSLAGELSSVFEKYQAWRRDWLLRWDAGAEPDDAQAVLWRAVAQGQPYRARRIGDYLARFDHADAPLPVGLPARLFAFATLNISPDVLRVLATQARVGTLHFYLPTPAAGWWGDLQTVRERLRAGAAGPALFADSVQDNPLLQAWGAAGRDFMAVLGGYEVVHPQAEIEAWVDPLQGARAPLAAGGLGDSLLRTLQSDLLHRRMPAAVRAAFDRSDPSLQVHACHTRLRELQVLHDQLRGLLEDPRFDPPLQPRDIAVLAPDIDPYVPYLDAVFGGSGHGDALPWALADTSPLAGEPLAEVFLRLLDLPIARFGLDETLDLLASAPIAEAAGLDADAVERLHGWLREAGARWALDAAHRAALGAPQDEAFTWQFALDRLLLGHASGSDAEVAGVAAWPGLEGSALAALDTLIRLLRELARQAKALGQPGTAAQWRERLLKLLDALLPSTPASPRAARALERLRVLVNDFAKAAEAAGYTATVPAEVVRAHFAEQLTQADTRAPLLTGGISFGRMVPMRLLPFRVICLLGMNDGDFPRRDPAAGLNKLVAELGTAQRRPGDRSTREDDRFLFLQLLSSAQDVFYLSYLGADPRDGSAREPSVMVGELLDAVAACHLPAEGETGQARKARIAGQLVVRHPLQPFAPAAFGGQDEPRRFSYRAQWHPAAGRVGGARQALSPWLADALPTPAKTDAQSDDVLPLEALRRFFADPQGQFLAQRLGLRLPEAVEPDEDVEPLVLPVGGLQGTHIRQYMLDALRDGREAGLREHLRARALLPSGALGACQFDALLAQVRPFADASMAWADGAVTASEVFEADIDGLRLRGRVQDLHPRGLLRVRPAALNGNTALRWGLDWLLTSAAGADVPLVQIHDTPDAGPGPFVTAALQPQHARAALRQLLAIRAEGLRAPLPFAPYTGWDIWCAENAEKGRAAAYKRWHGDGNGGFAEGEGAAIRLALRGRDPFADEAAYARMEALSLRIYDLLRTGSARADAIDGEAA